jgi:hypothetical protein
VRRMTGTGPGLRLVAEDIRQHDTHNTLTWQEGLNEIPFEPLQLDAIIVPGSRTEANLNQAITLARAADCWLLILCSRQLRGIDAVRQLASRSYRKAIVIDVPPGYSHELFHFAGLASIRDELPEASRYYATDLSMKRNIGLAMARMLNWQRVFFLDDDIRDVSYPQLESTVNMLSSFAAVGLWITEFPDNSVVCHANRAADRWQDVFVSGAALAVDVTADIGFFPDIYNEDWFFFFDYAAEKRLANSRSEVTQLKYDPFANPRRAAWQEFGDLLAEGLYTMLHLDLQLEQAGTDYWMRYWTRFLEERRIFLEAVNTRAQNKPLENEAWDRDQVVNSVRWAIKTLQEITPDVCDRYIRLWREDLSAWKMRLAGLTAVPSLELALARLRLAAVGPAYKATRVRSYGPAATSAFMPGPVTPPRFETTGRMSERM